MGDGDHVEKNKKEAKGLKRHIFDARNVLPTFWVRFPFQIDHGGKWLILGSRSYLLWNLRIFLCILYFAIQAVKQF